MASVNLLNYVGIAALFSRHDYGTAPMFERMPFLRCALYHRAIIYLLKYTKHIFSSIIVSSESFAMPINHIDDFFARAESSALSTAKSQHLVISLLR